MKKSFLKFLEKKQKGFTLAEVLVSIAIVISLTVLVLANFEWGGYNFALERSVREVSQQIRMIEEMAFSSKEIEGVVPKGGYGIHFDSNFKDKYILFADKPDPDTGIVDWKYGLEDQIIGEYPLEKDVLISVLSDSDLPVPSLDVVFLPPDPKVYIDGLSSGGGSNFFAKIILSAINESTGSISVNGVGLIETEK
jgi:prepilin-type N-terminal cleavage/methylation domain-containing protein